MKKRLLSRAVLLVLLVSGFVQAQRNYSVTHYTSENGLPQNSIKTLFADPEGFIWLGTEDGLVRFDGQQFLTFNRINLKVSNNRVIFGRLVSKDKNRQQQGSGETGKTQDVYYAAFWGWETVRIQRGRAVLDTVYARNYLKKVAPFEKGPGTFILATGFPNFSIDSTRLERYMVTTGYGDKNFFICGKDRITYYQDWKKRYSRRFVTGNLWNYFSMGEALFHYQKAANLITVFSGREPVTRVVGGDILLDPAYKSPKRDINLHWNNVSDQAFLRLGNNLYLLYKTQNGNVSTRLLVEGFDLAAEGIEEIYYDTRSKNIFLGSPTEGLFVLKKQQFRVITTKGEARENVFYAQIPFDKHTVLTATGQLLGKDMGSGLMTDRQNDLVFKINPSDRTFLIRAKDSTIWIPNGPTLYRLDAKAEKIIGKWNFENLTTRIHEGLSGKIWVSTYEKGLFRIDPDDEKAEPVQFFKEPIPHITAIKSENARSLLVGTIAGLYRVDILSRKPTLIQGTKTFHITSIHLDQDQNRWFTAVDKGIIRLGPDDKPVVFPLDKNKYLASPHYIIDDKRGYFWIPTNKGLFQIAQKDLLYYAAQKTTPDKQPVGKKKQNEMPLEIFYKYYAKEDGFNTNEFNGGCDPCAATLANGYISMPSLIGLVWFKPGQIETDVADSKIILDRVEVNGRNLAFSGDTIRFNLNPENVKLYFSTPYFGNLYNLHLSYALVRTHAVAKASDWIPINMAERDIRFSSLSSGNYTLLIRKVDGFGFGENHVKVIHLIVPPNWYETWWAIAFFLSFAGAAVYGYIHLRLRKIEREKAKLEALVCQRTKELSETMFHLQESKNEMTKKMYVLSRLLASMTHDIQSPLNFVAITSSNIPAMLEAQQLTEVAKVGEIIADSTRRMSLLLKDLLNYIRVNVYGNRMQFEEIRLRELIEQKFAMFRNMLEKNNTVFVNDVHAEVVINSDLQMVSILIHNLIDNASKFTRNGQVTIHADCFEDHKVELVIANSALGIPQHVMDMINDTAADETEDVSLPANKAGLGLLIVKEVSDLIGVPIRVTDTDLTRFHLVFEH